MFAESHIHPLIFEECYVKDNDPAFVSKVKKSTELTEAKMNITTEQEILD